MTPEIELPDEGTVIGNYRLGGRIGAGGMGVVYSGQDLRLQRRVAIKILPQPAAGEDTERVKRFQREARAASALNHPNIVSIFDADFDRGYYYIAMELIEGRTLRQLIAIEAGQLEPLTILDLVSQTAAALGAAHEAGIVHRDVKPENIMVRPDGFVKVLDFGLAKLREPPQSVEVLTRSALVTQPGSLAGTIQYMSPEQVAGKPADARSDIFSLGVVAYELATGVRPFDGPTDGAVYAAILHQAPAPPSSLRPELGGELSSLILRALDKDPDLRFQTAADLRSLCKRLIRDCSVSDALAPSDANPPSPPPHPAASRRSRPAWPVALAVVALLVAAAVWIAVKPSASIQPTLMSFERQTDEPGEEVYPSLSPDGKQFVYASPRSGNWDIYLKRTGGVAAVNLTKDFAGNDSEPAFSRDGTRIAFRSDRDGGGIFVMEATGENPRRVSTAGYHPAWSPNGSQLVYCTLDFNNPSRRARDRFSSLVILELAGGTAREVATSNTDAVQPAWSPHGSRIAYWGVVGNTGQRDIFTVPADGTGPPVAVTSDSAIDWNPVWSPTGDLLYFLSDRGGTMNVWRVRIDETSGQVKGPPEPVVVPAIYTKHFTMAAGGTHFAFVRADERTSLYAARFDPAALRMEGEPEAVGDGRNAVFSFSLSPDETKIAFDTVGDPQEDIWLMNADGSGRRRLTKDAFMDRDPAWSPDGKEIVFFSDRGSKTLNAWAIRADGGGLRRLTDFPPSLSVTGVAWSHDGKRVFLTPQPLPSSSIPSDKVSTAPDRLRGLEPYGSAYLPPWNPPLRPEESDKWLMVASDGKRDRVWIYTMSTGKAEPTPIFGPSPSWLPGQKQFVSRNGDKISLYDLPSGKEHILYSAYPNRPWQIRVTREGTRIFFTQMAREGEIWVGRTSD